MAAAWRQRPMSNDDLLQFILENGATISPIFSVPGVTNHIFRIDWLHCVDQGVAADFLGNIFKISCQKMPGENIKIRCAGLWARLQAFYTRNSVGDRLQNLVPTMFLQPKKAPKLRCSAAQCRAMIPFALEMVAGFSDNDAVESTAKLAVMHLDQCYKALSRSSIFAADVLQEHSVKFGLLYVALERAHEGTRDFKVKPKLHLFQELCSERGKPALCWNYRDEDWGGTVSKMSRRRGGLLSVQAFSANMLHRFKMQQPVIRMRQ